LWTPLITWDDLLKLAEKKLVQKTLKRDKNGIYVFDNPELLRPKTAAAVILSAI